MIRYLHLPLIATDLILSGAFRGLSATVCVLLVFLLLVTGCAATGKKGGKEGLIKTAVKDEDIKSSNDTQPTITPPNSSDDFTKTVTLTFFNEPMMKMLPIITPNVELDEGIDPNTPVSLDVKDVSVGNALTSLLKPVGLTYTRKTDGIFITKQPVITFTAYNQPLSVVLSSMMSGFLYSIRDGAELFMNTPVTVEFKNIPLEQSLDNLLTPVKLFWVKDGNTYIIFREKEALFYVDFPVLEQSFEVASSRAGDTTGAQATTTSAGLSQTGVAFSRGGISATLSTSTAKGKVSSADNLVATIKEFLTKDGKIAVQKEMGAIWIRDRADIVDMVGGYLKSINKSMRRSVKINGIITEVTLRKGFEAGINWDSVTGSVNVSAQNLNASANAVGLMKLKVTWDKDFINALMLALNEFGNVRVVSKPSLTVANGAIGSLIVGTTISYVAQSYVSITSAQTSTSSLIVQPLQTGLSFYVLPRIISDEEAVLYIAPELTSLQEIRTISSGNTTVEAPSLEMKQTQTIVSIKNGETLILSGLMSESNRKEDRSVPLLGDIPILGWAFKYKKDEKKTSEFALMIEVAW